MRKQIIDIIDEHIRMYSKQKKNSDITQNEYLQRKMNALKVLRKHILTIDFNEGLI